MNSPAALAILVVCGVAAGALATFSLLPRAPACPPSIYDASEPTAEQMRAAYAKIAEEL